MNASTEIKKEIKKMKIDWKWISNDDGLGGTFKTCSVCHDLQDNPESIHTCAFQNHTIKKVLKLFK